jgi:hypothetical protein
MLSIFYVSSASRPTLLQYAPDYTWHFVGYFVMGLLAIRAFARGLALPASGRAVLYGVMLSLAYALSDEWHQSFVPGRTASLHDLTVDSLGIAGALGLLSLYWRKSAAWQVGARVASEEPPAAVERRVLAAKSGGCFDRSEPGGGRN